MTYRQSEMRYDLKWVEHLLNTLSKTNKKTGFYKFYRAGLLKDLLALQLEEFDRS